MNKDHRSTHQFSEDAEFLDNLIRRAGCGDSPIGQLERINNGPSTQQRFENVLTALATIRLKKVLSYGESRYFPDNAKKAMALQYGDLQRKFIRIENALFGEDQQELSNEMLDDTLADLANYAIMMIEVRMELRARGLL